MKMRQNENNDLSPINTVTTVSMQPDATSTGSTSSGSSFSTSKKTSHKKKVKVNVEHLCIWLKNKDQCFADGTRQKCIQRSRVDYWDWNFCMFTYNHMKSLDDERSKFMLQTQIQSLTPQAKYVTASGKFIGNSLLFHCKLVRIASRFVCAGNLLAPWNPSSLTSL